MAISDANGQFREKLAYDAWGKRRSTDGSATDDSIDGQTDNKGFTGHEMLDQLNLVHMNGRVYDPFTAKFVSGDPFVQDPANGQSYNRYSYVLNNPTNATDPTGFIAVTGSNLNYKTEEDAANARSMLGVGCMLCGSDFGGNEDANAVKPQVKPNGAKNGTISGGLTGNSTAEQWKNYSEAHKGDSTAGNIAGFVGEWVFGMPGRMLERLGDPSKRIPNGPENAAAAGLALVGGMAGSADKWQRTPQSVQDQMALSAAKDGAGVKIISNLKDSKYPGMEKWEYKVKSEEGRDSVVHYVRDPRTGDLKDFKFKKSSVDTPHGNWERTPDPKSSGSGIPPSWWPF